MTQGLILHDVSRDQAVKRYGGAGLFGYNPAAGNFRSFDLSSLTVEDQLMIAELKAAYPHLLKKDDVTQSVDDTLIKDVLRGVKAIINGINRMQNEAQPGIAPKR